MTFHSSRFDMGTVMNKLRSIAEAGTEEKEVQSDTKSSYHDPESETGGKEIDQGSFSRTMQRIAAIKDAVSEDNYNALRTGVRSLYMNRRPNLQQMTALMDLLETVLSYVASDNTLFQRLKADLNKDAQEQEAETNTATAPETTDAEVGAPETVTPVKQPEMRSLKA